MEDRELCRDPIIRAMPMHCDVCEVSEELGLLAVAMYELKDERERVGRVSCCLHASSRMEFGRVSCLLHQGQPCESKQGIESTRMNCCKLIVVFCR